jgi:ABC-type transport system substrate-binding protein
MRKTSKILVLFLLISSTVIPFIPVAAVPKVAAPIRFRIGDVGAALEWDTAVSLGYSVIDWYKLTCTEYLAGLPNRYDRGLSKGVPKEDTWYPLLAESWEVDKWPEKNNSMGWVNRGGYANITYTLRKNVTFHDGSIWNATACKWNYDRAMIISGNLTGRGDMSMRDTFWIDAVEWQDYYTEDWNKSEYIGGYGWYYDSVNDINYSNPSPYGGMGIIGPIHWAPWEMYPMLKQVVIVEPGDPYGGKVRLEFNDWNGYGMSGVGLLTMISMKTYKDFWDRGVYGYDNADPNYPDHMVGTGPYIYVDHDETGSPGGGSMVKNYNYWNRTGLEDAGWFDVDYADVIIWPPDQQGASDRDNALKTHAIDFGYDNYWVQFDYDYLTTDPIGSANINWKPRPEDDFITSITLNCINETWYVWPSIPEWVGILFPTAYPAGNTPSGVPRALRKAMNYAFDYDTFINTGLNGRAVRAGGVMGVTNLYYNASIPLPDYNKTYAREILLTTETDPYTYSTPVNFSDLCKDRGLDFSSTDLDWQNVSDTNPIWELDFYWDDRNAILAGQLETSLRDIGCALKDPGTGPGADGYHIVDPHMWDKVGTYWFTGFPVFSAQAWPLDWNMPEKTSEGYIQGQYGDPNFGNWRTNPGLPYTYDWWYWFPYFTLSFSFDAQVDEWFRHMWLSNDTGRYEWFDKISNRLQNEIYPRIYVSQYKAGWAHWRQWNMSGFWSGASPAMIDYLGTEEVFPPISGFPVGMVLTVSAVTLIGLVYIRMRKKKITDK